MVALVVVGSSAPRMSQAVMPTREGSVPSEVSRAFDQGLFDVSDASGLHTNVVYPTWKIPVILADFTDQPMTFTDPAGWDRALFDSTASTATGSVFDYYQWVSGGRLRVLGKVVASVHLSRPKAAYADSAWGLGSDPTKNIYAAVDEALRLAPGSVDWSEYDRDVNGKVDVVWVVHSGIGGEHVANRRDLWSITSKLSEWPNGYVFETGDFVPGTNVKEIIDAFSILPEMSVFQFGNRSEIGVYCHEFGHSLGLPDLYERGFAGGTQNVGVGNWSLMSTGAYGTDGLSPQFPSHLGAWPTLYMGWATTVHPTENGSMALGPIETGGKILDLWFQGEQSAEHFLVENRQRKGFDRNLVDSGLVIYHLNDAYINAGLAANRVISGSSPALKVVEGDGRYDLIYGANHGEPTDPFPGLGRVTRWDDTTVPNSRSNDGSITFVGLNGIQVVGDSVRFQVQVRAPGWKPPRNASEVGLEPMIGSGRGARAGMLPDGGAVVVTSEYRDGKPQIMLRTRSPNHEWGPPFVVSSSSGTATEPSIGVLPGGDLCVTWSDSRHGPNELYFRSRVLGVWTPERRLTDLPGYSRSPALSADERGGVQIAWHYVDGGTSHVRFLYFSYLMPGGTSRVLSPAGAQPDPPALAAGRGGSSYAVWTDRGGTVPAVWFTHFTPDSGAQSAKKLTQGTGILSGVSAAVDANGMLHTLWQVSGTDGNTIRYQTRSNVTRPDSILIRRGDSIHDFFIAPAADGGLHVIVEASVAGSSQILYKEMRPRGFWDVGATEITRVGDPPATRPMALPFWPGYTTLLYLSFGPSGWTLVEKDNGEWQSRPTAVLTDAPTSSSLALRAGPNPLRAGAALRMRFDGEVAADGRIDVFDVSGRRVATTTARPLAGRWSAEIPASTTGAWRDGVYFVRAASGRARATVVVIR